MDDDIAALELEAPLACDRCGETFARGDLLLDDDGYTCTECEFERGTRAAARAQLWREVAAGPLLLVPVLALAALFVASGAIVAGGVGVMALLTAIAGLVLAGWGATIAVGRKDYGAFDFTARGARALVYAARGSGLVLAFTGLFVTGLAGLSVVLPLVV